MGAAFHNEWNQSMHDRLDGKQIAILVDRGFEQAELTGPKYALEQAGAVTHLVSPQVEQVKAWRHHDWGDYFPVEVPLDQAAAGDYDGLLLPGGVMNSDKLRASSKAQAFVRAFFDAGKPVAAICHAPWLLVDAGVAAGYTLTSYPSLQLDLQNAGAIWIDQDVVVDGGLITSQSHSDLPAFNRMLVHVFTKTICAREGSSPQSLIPYRRVS